MRRATHFTRIPNFNSKISIHALREESDSNRDPRHCKFLYFNPRSPWGERLLLFLINGYALVISIHALREESDEETLGLWQLRLQFQSTLSVRRATPQNHTFLRLFPHFNPRSPWGERPNNMGTQNDLKYISIHALREESDLLSLNDIDGITPISIHALREESDVTKHCNVTGVFIFQSTLSVRRAT